jgi:hypothetical protein
MQPLEAGIPDEAPAATVARSVPLLALRVPTLAVLSAYDGLATVERRTEQTHPWSVAVPLQQLPFGV